MARTLSLLTVLALAAAALLLTISAAAPAGAGAATSASGCSGVTITPATRSVGRGGHVQLHGSACAPTYSTPAGQPVVIRIKKGKRWALLARATAATDGSYSLCPKVRPPKGTKTVRLQATTSTGDTATTTLRVSGKGGGSCEPADDGSSVDDGSGGGYTPPPPEQGSPDCPLSTPGSTIGLTLPSSCTVVGSDTSSDPDPLPFWGSVQAVSGSRHQQVGSGGDGHATALGTAQGDSAFRRMTVFDGDDFWG